MDTVGECMSLSGLFPSVSTCNRKSTLKCCHVASAHTHTAPSQPYTIPQPLVPELAMVKWRKLTIVLCLSKHMHTSSSHHRHHYTHWTQTWRGQNQPTVKHLFCKWARRENCQGFNWGCKAHESLCGKPGREVLLVWHSLEVVDTSGAKSLQPWVWGRPRW